MELALAERRIFRFFKTDILVAGVAWRKPRERFAAKHLPPVLTA
jgi:hypothetical protein